MAYGSRVDPRTQPELRRSLQAFSNRLDAVMENRIPGEIIYSAIAFPTGDGMEECNGQGVSKEKYADFWEAQSGTWPFGSTTSNFTLPNASRKTLVGRGGTGTGVLANTVGATGGTETHLLVTTEIPSHTHLQNAHAHTFTGDSSSHTHTFTGDAHNHTVTDPGHTHDYLWYQSASFGADVPRIGGSGPADVSGTTVTQVTGISLASTTVTGTNASATVNVTGTVGSATATNQNTGGDTAHNNMQPSLVMYVYIFLGKAAT